MKAVEFNTTQLKSIGMFTMFLDHFALFILTPLLTIQDEIEFIFWIQLLIFIFRTIGRLAFPIFSFLITNGYKYTHNKSSYLIRLVAFAFISEPFFDLSMSGVGLNGSHQNVFFTLAFGVISIWGFDLIFNKFGLILSWIWVFLIGSLAEYLNFDYGFYGILMIALMFVFSNQRKQMNLIVIALNLIFVWPSLMTFSTILNSMPTRGGYALGLDILMYLMGIVQIFSVFALPIISKYKGKKGKLVNKYLFYMFYPIHLLVLSI